VTVPHVSPRRLLNVHPQPVDLPAGGGEVTLELELPLSQSFNFSLSCYILSEELQLVYLQLGDFILQLAQLAGHHITLKRDHGDVTGHDLLTGGVQGHVVVLLLLVGHVGLTEGGQTGSLLG